MKIVSFKVAKALKDAGYPQGCENNAYYNENGMLIKPNAFNCSIENADAPTYIEVWRWLGRKKGIQIDLDFTNSKVSIYRGALFCKSFDLTTNPEEDLIAAIEYLFDNDLVRELYRK